MRQSMKRGRKLTPRLPTGMPKPVAELAKECIEHDYLDAVSGRMADPKGYIIRMEAAQAAYDHYTLIGGEGVAVETPEEDALAATRSEMTPEAPE